MSCRICLDENEHLIKVCRCSGSLGLVHSQCINKWRKTKKINKCEICNTKFNLKKTTKYSNTSLLYLLSTFIALFAIVYQVPEMFDNIKSVAIIIGRIAYFTWEIYCDSYYIDIIDNEKTQALIGFLVIIITSQPFIYSYYRKLKECKYEDCEIVEYKL